MSQCVQVPLSCRALHIMPDATESQVGVGMLRRGDWTLVLEVGWTTYPKAMNIRINAISACV